MQEWEERQRDGWLAVIQPVRAISKKKKRKKNHRKFGLVLLMAETDIYLLKPLTFVLSYVWAQ